MGRFGAAPALVATSGVVSATRTTRPPTKQRRVWLTYPLAEVETPAAEAGRRIPTANGVALWVSVSAFAWARPRSPAQAESERRETRVELSGSDAGSTARSPSALPAQSSRAKLPCWVPREPTRPSVGSGRGR